jgi:hypothetical protein
VRALARLPDETMIDGEVVALDESRNCSKLCRGSGPSAVENRTENDEIHAPKLNHTE